MKNNKGFSLVELIIVIAIMAILVGVMAPQLIKYIEKSKISSDKTVCDTVRTAYLTALADPDVVNASDYTMPTGNAAISLGNDTVSTAVIDILGTNDPDKGLKSTTRDGHGISVSVGGANQIAVYCTINPAIGAGPGFEK